MELFNAIHTRRSIRKYTDQDVPEEMIRKILGAAMMAPSAGDERPWQFIVVTDPQIKAQLKEVNPYATMIAKAPLGILICADKTKEKYEGYWPQDCAAAMQNLLLAAHAQGLGAVWTGVYPMQDRVEKINRIFNLPPHIIPFALAVIGFPAQQLPTQDRFDPTLIHHNVWESK